MKAIGNFIKGIFSKDGVIHFRNHFFTGLFFILPLIVTMYVIFFIFKLFGSVSGEIINSVFFSGNLNAPLELFFGFIMAVFFIALIGYFARLAFIKSTANRLEEYIGKLPFISMIYSTTKKIIQSVTTDNKSFRSVVLIEYPRKGIYTLGFITRESFPDIVKDGNKEFVSVFVPTTPNPTSGFFLIIPRKEVKQLKMSVEEGLQLIISAGVLSPDEQLDEQIDEPEKKA